jgi:asparagine synthase (glutamine-hydrolysing)
VSGFAAVLSLDAAPVDLQSLARLLAALTARGPDAQSSHIVGPIGLAHTLLRTTTESAEERQPFTVDGREWIVADSRVDDRRTLITALTAAGCRELEARPDVELILHAYRVWGDACVTRLLGDFAFVVWDDRQRRLFCARDQFGVKPFFYANAGDRLVVSNTLDCLLAHASVDATLNELAIADFLVAGGNLELETTVYRGIARLRAAHTLVWDARGVRTSRYWSGITGGRIRYRRAQEYVEHFQHVIGAAVGDRLRTHRAVISMSGGLDSTSVALAARRQVDAGASSCELRVFTSVYDRLFRDEERRYAGLAAASLRLPIRFFPADDIAPFSYWDDPRFRTPEPHRNVFGEAQQIEYEAASAFARVMLTGYGGDPLFQYQTDVTLAWQQGRLGAVIADVVRASLLGRLPPIGVRTTIRRWKQRHAPKPTRTYPIPEWLDPAFVKRLNLDARYREWSVVPPPMPTLTRDAQRAMFSPTWPRAFELLDPATTGFPIEHRYPFFDLRVVDYVWSIPPVPWSQDKGLLRAAMQGQMHDEVRKRPKTPLAGDQLASWCEDPSNRARLSGLVSTPRARCCARAFPPRLDSGDRWLALRPFSLEYWLRMSNREVG